MPLKYRLLTLVLGIPLLLLMLYIGYLFLQDRQQRRDMLQDHLNDSVELLAPSLARALNGDRERLEPLLQRLLDLREVSSIVLRGGDGQVLVRLGETQPLQGLPRNNRTRFIEEGDQWRLFKPLPMIPLSWARRDESSQPHWLEMTIRDTDLTLATYRQLAHHALAWLVMAVLLLAVAYGIQRRILPNLRAQRSALQRLIDGEYGYRVRETGPRELASLARAVNRLGEHLLQSREAQRLQLEQSTAELQESMETIEIQNIELDMARRRALQANRIKSEFLANMSHEIRTPLNGIIGFCRLLGRGRLDNREREWLEHIETASNNLLTLINGILDFSKIEAGKLELEAVAFDMVALVDEVLTLQAPASQEKDLQLLGLVFDDVPAELVGDPYRIKQVLINLVSNAIKFTDRGEVIVRVLVEEVEGNATTLRIRVSDTGIGLPADIQEHLFKPFSQGSLSRARRYGGSGLGLMICKQLVEQMGGEITVASQPEGGSEFSFTLALHSLTPDTERAPEVRLAAPLIALWEPHGTTRQALGHQFRRWGARVRIIERQEEKTTAETPDLLVVSLARNDLHRDALHSWGQCLAALDCPVLVLANTDPYELADLTLPPGSEILCKPVPRARLCEAVKRTLAGKLDTTTAPSPDLPDTGARNARVLIVDDIASNRRLVEELLRQAGVEPLLAESGEEAVALAHDSNVDLVLMDIRMPGMNGVDTMRALRRLGGRWANCPFVALTAHAVEGETRWLLEAGMQEVLTKPLDEQALARVLTTHLGMPAPFFDKPAPPIASDDEPGDLPVVDMQLGRTMAGGRADIAEDTLEMLLGSLDDSEAALRESFAADDGEAFLDAVHRLNGACRYCGVPELALLSETLETRVRAQGHQAAQEMLEDVFRAMQRLREWQASRSQA
ncbi:two-component system, NarL family, sensor histidine kinase BarA [Modicisalibacter ilicicola DSM 19980]|uniref:histidine kinase n=1 Tax=Modicisalibacter ilicicola DSM 19980 TaxID=1121942 RepID=A0A1M5D8K1_9GAMM|nr:ATP-binding protein [Halomonas ilicicola]SHF63353.1 two-component system, NarL family, sensor histidine kinase BarA [Halomonas ilicicola DSM 19980]